MISTGAKAQISFRRILVATDFSECSEGALRYALGIAHRYGSRVYFAHAVHSLGYTLGGAEVLEAAREQAWRDAERLEGNLVRDGSLQGIQHQFLINVGPPWDILLQIIDHENIDLIVLGTHGRSGLGKLLLGSCAENVFRGANCPVLTVGPHVPGRRSAGNVPGHILVPTDFSPEAMHAARYALSLASEAQAEVTGLHVIDKFSGEAAHDKQVVLHALQERIGDWLAAIGDWPAQPKVAIKVGTSAEAILDAAEEHRVDLIVMGIHAPSTSEDFLMWPNAYKVVCEATCPVMTIRT